MTRTNVDIDDELMSNAMEALGTHTKKETIEIALTRAIRDWKLRGIRDLRGKIPWEGDLLEMRRSRHMAPEGAE
jgi:Arc/MetJ family transcription regulator